MKKDPTGGVNVKEVVAKFARRPKEFVLVALFPGGLVREAERAVCCHSFVNLIAMDAYTLGFLRHPHSAQQLWL